jgi:RNA polymerase sigma factor (sigma-70 family)
MRALAEENRSKGVVQANQGVLDDCELVREALDRLDDESRLVLTLVHFEGLTYAEVGAVLGWRSKGTVCAKVRKATERLKELLSQLSGGGC